MNKVHMILDEAASLGHLECLDDAVDKYRAYALRLIFIFQSLGQLKKSFPDGQDQTLLSNVTTVFFGVNDNATAEYVSNRLGESTIVVESGGSSSGSSDSWSFGGQPQHGGGSSDNVSSNWQQQARKLLKPEEVMALSPRTAITFTPGVPPICTTLMRYYEEKWLTRPPGWIRRSVAACCTLVASSALFVLAAGFATAMTLAVKDAPSIRAMLPSDLLQWLDAIGRF